MTTLPHDIADLYLAPAALQIDTRLDELGSLTLDQLETRAQLEANMSLGDREKRQRALLLTVAYVLDNHGWELSWHARGLELRHGVHALVLGVPPLFQEFLTAVPRAAEC
jgi:hypothetical protein